MATNSKQTSEYSSWNNSLESELHRWDFQEIT